jgi:elongation factor 2 kinase
LAFYEPTTNHLLTLPHHLFRRFITGQDRYGAGFTKHNTNSGFVDTSLRRNTPQLFSAFSFYSSKGTRLVADIQGVGDLYTDPQVLSNDYRFGEGDLGPRGMALFFKGFRHNHVSDALGIPIFALSKNELRVQEKYDEDEETVSSHDAESYFSGEDLNMIQPTLHPFETLDEDESEPQPAVRPSKMSFRNKFERLDLNRLRRSMLLKSPRDILRAHHDESDSNTEKRANLSRAAVSKSIRMSLRLVSPIKKHTLHRSRSEFDEVAQVRSFKILP